MSISKEFVTAGNATFTIEVPTPFQVGKPHYTFKVKVKEANDRWPEAVFVNLFIGTENNDDNSYKYMGMLDKGTGGIRATAKSCRKVDSYEFRLINRILGRIWAGDTQAFEQHGFQVHHEGTCGRCGRKLTVPESIKTGIGPECAKRM